MLKGHLKYFSARLHYNKRNGDSHVRFIFKDISGGRYGIRCFLDKNGNSKLDSGLFGLTEPWGMSFKGERPFGMPGFSDISFEVHADTYNIKIEVR